MSLAALTRLMLGVICLILVETGIAGDEDPRSRSDFYRMTFGQLDESTFAPAGRVRGVFKRLLRVADKAEYKDPRLLLIDSDSWPWAIALPDNTVVLTRGAVEVCYRGVSPEQGDIRLAMILGHELGHLAEDDYWHRDVYLTLSDRAGEQATDVLRFIGERSGLLGGDTGEWRTIVRDRELRADDRGYIYAALAGFEPGRLLSDEAVSFFHYWTEQTSAGPGNYHLKPTDRAAYLKARSSTLSELAELYQVGVALTLLGNLDVAEKVFRQVLNTFPSHEVYNNLGYIRLQKALDLLSVDLDRLFWFPATVDTTPDSPTLNATRSIVTLDSLLEEAVSFFRLALKQDPGYLTAHLNLSTAYYYLGRYNSAAAALADARKVAPDSAEIEALWQISMLRSLEDSVDYLPVALEKLAPTVLPADADPLLLYNAAQLLELAGRRDEANRIWRRLGDLHGQVPSPYRDVVLIRLGQSQESTPAASRSDSLLVQRFGELAIPPDGVDSLVFSLTLEGSALQRQGATRPGSAAGYLSGGEEILRRTIPAETIRPPDLLDCCGEPLVRQPTGLGEVWRYGDHWAFLLRDARVREIWRNPS